MNITLWILQILLAVAFLLHGWLYLSPPADMVALMNAAISPPFRLFIGAAEVLAAVGLTVPGMTRVMPWLVPCAAAGLTIVMASAAVFHISRNGIGPAITTAILFVVTAFVAYMRWQVMPILPRPLRGSAVT